VFSWATHDGDTALQMSPLLRDYPEAPLICPTQITPIEQLFAARPLLEEVIDAHLPAMTMVDLPRGATAIELQARCAFRAQAELRLHASPLEIVSTQITALDRGRLVHRVMEEVWTHIADHATLITLDEEALLARVRASAQRHAAALLTITTRVRERLVAIEVDWISTAIVQLLNLEKQRAPFRVRRSEQREPFSIAGYRLNIQPDRIDELLAGGAVVIDYKTGASIKPGHWIDRRPGRPARAQLPLYAIAHAEGLQALAAAVIAPGVTELRGFAAQRGLFPNADIYPEDAWKPPVSALHWSDLLVHWQVILESLVIDYAQGDASVDPLPQECRTCHLMSLCRISDRPLLAEVGESAGESGNDDE
jgi:ATP-dependent helicase/nuclease subunit B